MACKKCNLTVDFQKTNELIAEIDLKAEKLKKRILESKSKYRVKGNTYFVSPTGNDSNDGLTPVTAWKTAARVSNAPELNPGDVVLFQRGAMFRGNGIICRPGVTYSAYGEGDKPIINASPENGTGANNWKRVPGTKNIWVYKNKLPEVGMIIFDDGANHGIKHIPDFINGKYFVRDTNGEKAYDFKEQLTKNFEYFHDAEYTLFPNGRPDMYGGPSTGKLYLYCDMGNPGAVFSSIEFAVRAHGLRIGGHGITIDNLCVMYAGCHGISSGTTKNLTVRNSVFGWIGGAIQFYTETGRVVRFGNGIEIYGGCKNYLVENNYIYQCYDAGATHQYSAGGVNDIIMENTVYRNNLIEYCIYSIEYFLGVPAKESNATRYMKNTYIQNNIMRYAGFGFGEQRPYKKSAAHIKSWDHYNNSENFIIENNIMDRSRHMLVHVAAFDSKWLPVSRNNVYIQYLNHTGTFGRYDKVPSTNIPYSEDIAEILDKQGIEKNSEIYFAENDDISEIPNW